MKNFKTMLFTSQWLSLDTYVIYVCLRGILKTIRPKTLKHRTKVLLDLKK